jgi:hypothetical protein
MSLRSYTELALSEPFFPAKGIQYLHRRAIDPTLVVYSDAQNKPG